VTQNRKLIPFVIDFLLAGVIISVTLLNGFHSWHWLVSACIFVLLHIFLRVITSPRVRMLSKLSFRDTRQRKTSSALLFCGLMLASAVVSSSLIVGDSFDGTLEDRLVSSLGETDWVVEGMDPLTSSPLLMNESRVMDALDNLMIFDEIDGIGIELHQTVTGINTDGSKVNPNVVWFAPDENLRASGPWIDPIGTPSISWPQLGGESDPTENFAVVNQALSKTLDLETGSQFSVSWSEIIEDKTSRKNHNFTVQSVIDSTGIGWENANQPLLITTLKQAQIIQNKHGLVSRAVISGEGGVFDGYLTQEIEQKIESSFAQEMLASDSGFHWTGLDPGGVATLSRSSGGGLLTSGDVSGINSALQIAGHDSDASSFLLTPVSGIWDNDNEITTIDGTRIVAVKIYPDYDLIVSDSSVYFSSHNQQSFNLFFEDIIDAEFRDSDLFILTEQQIIVVNLTTKMAANIAENTASFTDITVSGSTLWAVSSQSEKVFWFSIESEFNGTEFSHIDVGISSEILSSAISSDGISIVAHFQTIFDSYVCWLIDNESSCESAGNSRMVFLHQNETFIESPNSIKRWNGSDFEIVHQLNSTLLGANSIGLIVDDHDSILKWSSNLSVFVNQQRIPLIVNGDSFDEFNGLIFASTNYGTVKSDENLNTSIQLFHSFEIGLGIHLPPFIISLEGESVSHLLGENQTIRFRDGIADFNQIETYSIGKNMVDDVRLEVQVNPSPVSLDQFIALNSDLELLDSAIIGTMSMDTAANLLGGVPKRSMILVQMPQNESNATVLEEALIQWANRRADIQSSSASLTPIKEEAILSIDGAGASFSALFLIFGVFIVTAGLLLIVNLWIMSADDRSQEWGLLRSIGASSQDIEWLLRIEGAVLATPACIVGSFLGLILAALLMGGLGAFFQATFGVGFSFYWTSKSLFVGASIGFLVSVITLRATSFFLSRRNLISSIRGLSNVNSSFGFWILLSSIFFAVVAFVLSLMSFFIGDFSPGLGHSLWVSGGSLFLLSLLAPLSALISRFLPARSRFFGILMSRIDASRNWASSIVGISVILFGLIDDPIRSQYEVSDTSLIVSGVFMLLGGVLILSTSGPIFIRRLLAIIGRSKPNFSAIFSLSIAHPQSRPVRSAVSMGMYSLVIFALIALSGYSTMFGNYVSDIGENSSGEYDILITGSGQELDVSPLLAWGENDLQRNGIDSLVVMQIGLCIISGDKMNATYASLRDIPKSFIESGALPLSEWDQSLGNNPVEIWEAVFADPNLAIVDASIGLETYSILGALPLEGGGASAGTSLGVRDPNRPLLQSNLRVAGVLTEDASLLLSGVFVSSVTFSSMVESSNNMAWVDVSEDVNLGDVASNLQLEFGADGASVLVVDELFDQISLILVSLLGLLRVFLALGLFIGVTGLAVVTARSINERSQQIGVMRAIGMQRREIIATILLEVGWISGLGIINGLIAGIIFYRLLFNAYIMGYGGSFVIPWLEFISIILFSIFMTLVAVLVPVKKGASISPSAAMRSL
tara:strand:+ start:206 stop:4762 length:4557 start_codon:yes stop_codon:yes gene_type:complete